MPEIKARDERSNRVVIENGLVRIEESRVLKTTGVEEFYSELVKNIPVETPILPPNVVYMKTYNRDSQTTILLVIESQPGIYKLNYGMRYGRSKPGSPLKGTKDKLMVDNYYLSFPFVYIWIVLRLSNPITIDFAGSFVTKKPLTTPDDILGTPPFPNIHNPERLGKFCLGNITVDTAEVLDNGKVIQKPLRGVIQDLVAGIFMSEFNSDINVYFPQEFRNMLVVNSFSTVAASGESKALRIIPSNTVWSDDSDIGRKEFYEAYLDLWEKASMKNNLVAMGWHYKAVCKFKSFTEHLFTDQERLVLEAGWI